MTWASATATTIGVATGAYLLYRVRKLEESLATSVAAFEQTSAQQRSVLQWLSQRIEVIDADVRTAGGAGRAVSHSNSALHSGTVTPPHGARLSSKGSSPAGSLVRAPSWESMVSEAGGGLPKLDACWQVGAVEFRSSCSRHTFPGLDQIDVAETL